MSPFPLKFFDRMHHLRIMRDLIESCFIVKVLMRVRFGNVGHVGKNVLRNNVRIRKKLM